MITKEICRDYALKIKEENGKFPIQSNWVVSNGYPCGYWKLLTLFGKSYNNFRDYCEEPQLLRTQSVTLDWVKLNCTIDENQCWNWNKAIKESGYGHIGIEGKSHVIHRVTFELANGIIPEKLLVRHKCDNRKCCNPDHLELGTQSENIKDFYNRNPNYISKNNTDRAGITNKFNSIEERVNYHIDNATLLDNCLLCSTLQPQTNGYYNIVIDGKYLKLHRLILSLKLQKTYDELLYTRHICNNKLCINPDHLVEGTNADNSIDFRKYSKATKLTEDNVREIRIAVKSADFSTKGNKSKFDKYWADKFKVSSNTILNIRLYNHYKDIVI